MANSFSVSSMTFDLSERSSSMANDGFVSDAASFNFTDGEGEPCSLRLVCSGYNTLIHHASFDEYNAEATNTAGQSVRVSQRVENSFVLPERIDVTLTKGGSTVATAELASAVQLRGGDNEFDYKRDAVDLALAVSVGEYRWAIDRIAFEGRIRDLSNE